MTSTDLDDMQIRLAEALEQHSSAESELIAVLWKLVALLGGDVPQEANEDTAALAESKADYLASVDEDRAIQDGYGE